MGSGPYYVSRMEKGDIVKKDKHIVEGRGA